MAPGARDLARNLAAAAPSDYNLPVLHTPKAAAFLGLAALGVALGAVLVGHLVILPGLEQNPGLLDQNQVNAVAGPLHLRISGVVLVASVVLAAVAHRWLDGRIATTLALLLTGIAGVQCFVIVPRLTEAWSRVDAVARRPVAALEQAETWASYQLLASAATLTLLLALTAVAAAVTTRHDQADASAT